MSAGSTVWSGEAIDRKARLGMFFAFASAAEREDEPRADDYEKQFEQFMDVEIDTSGLVAV